MKLTTRLENVKGVVHSMTFLSLQLVEIDKNYWWTLPRLNSLCHRLSLDQPQPGSFFQRPREAEKRDPGNEVVNKGWILLSFTQFALHSRLEFLRSANKEFARKFDPATLNPNSLRCSSLFTCYRNGDRMYCSNMSFMVIMNLSLNYVTIFTVFLFL